jgi:hypothetical protein
VRTIEPQPGRRGVRQGDHEQAGKDEGRRTYAEGLTRVLLRRAPRIVSRRFWRCGKGKVVEHG